MNQEIIMSFICIVQQQTISAAAKTLLASQSTISHRIQVLEQELGVTLFDRQRGFKKMTLTEDGKRFYPLAMQWLELNSQMHQISWSVRNVVRRPQESTFTNGGSCAWTA